MRYRTAVVPVTLSAGDYRRAHEGCHNAALIWNQLVIFQRTFWDVQETDPDYKQLREHIKSLPEELRTMHSQTQQAIVDDVIDAVATYRANKKAGRNSRAPWREKNYRPLSFTTQGWRVGKDGRLFMSMGRNQQALRLPLPTILDPQTGEPVHHSGWGEIRLCWDADARQFSLHIAVTTKKPVALNPEITIAIDPGIINPMTVAVQTDTGYQITIVNGREARAIKHRRNKTVASLTSKMSKATKNSNRWRKLNRLKKRAAATAAAQLRNIDHNVSRKIADVAIRVDGGDIAIGDVRGIEQKTKQAEQRRFGRNQRRRLSQWSRGKQEDQLAWKTGTELRHIDESYSSKTCPACLTRNRPAGRDYRCQHCAFTCHRDAVGAINILMRAIHGDYRRIDPDAIIEVIYLRATPLTVSALSKARNRAVATTALL
jgi:putative transposase